MTRRSTPGDIAPALDTRMALIRAAEVLFTDRGVILEQGPPAEVIGDPKEERTRQFLDRILNPL